METRSMSFLVVVLLVVTNGALAQTEWVDDAANPVIGPAEPGTWDGGSRNPLAVIEVDGTYHLYFNGQPEGSPMFLDFDIGHATSTDGSSWEMDPANPVLTRGAEGEWDDATMWGAAVIHDQSGFRMWYCGGHGDTKRAGYATSLDGSTWTKWPGNPIVDVGPPGSFDEKEVKPNAVIVQDGLYQMWYSGGTSWTGSPTEWDWQIGYAESTDGLSWTKRSEPVLSPGIDWESHFVATPSVLFDGATYHMWYTGGFSGTSLSFIGYAVSSDGIEWSRYVGNPVLVAPPNEGYQFANVLVGEDGVYQMWYGDYAEGGVFRATSSCCRLAWASFIPAAALAGGAEGSFYETDVDVSNAGASPAEFRFAWLPRGTSNDEWISSETFTLGAGMSVRYNNVLAEVFGLGPDVFGAIVVEASSTDLLAMARIANVMDAKAKGTYGQAMTAIRPEELISSGERRRIVFGTEHDAMRTNIGCFNAGDLITAVSLELIAADGTSLEKKLMVLLPWGNDQINRILGDYRPMTGAVDVWTDNQNRSFYCYGSVLDNTTSDPTTIPPQ